ncbi:GDSL lipase [Mycobacterium sp. MFM001]|uniref:Rv0518 family GDSL lipase n=1 Tax=Mycobacterium sp. MFM001 TaxID=2049453 RepID=UPI001EDE85FB|nr:GDSL lipase [Mycobacterium sp. MFM001]
MGRLAALVVSLTFAIGMIGMVSGYRAPAPYRTLTRGSSVNHVAVIGDSYTTGTDEGGLGSKAWTSRAWVSLSRQGVQIAPDVASEGRAGYAVRGDHGSVFEDLTARAVRPNDALVVFFGSRNDQGVEPELLGQMAHDTLDLAHRTAPAARLLVIGPPWPTADPPEAVLQVRDIIGDQARAMGATFVDPIAEHWFVGKPDLIGPDGVHPTDAGHEYMADKIAPLIRAQLPRLT